jgi:uncharacterized protein
MRKAVTSFLATLGVLLPALTGRVVDGAEVIDAATEARLTETLQAFEQRSSDQLVVATIPSLDGEAIEAFANRLFRAWGLGQAGENNGVLLLIAPNDRRMRIEGGYGLEGTLTDLHSKLIIENVLVPAFRAGDFGPGIEAAVSDIIGVLSGDAAELEARYQRNAPTMTINGRDNDSGMPIFIVLFLIVWATIFFGSIFAVLIVPRFGRKIGPHRYVWRGMTFDLTPKQSSGRSSSGGGWSSGGSSSRSSGGFSGGGGSSGGGGASGSW